MKNLSYWGKQHPVQARVIITLCHVLLVINAFGLGLLSYFSDIVVTWWVPLVLGNLFFLAYFFYPSKAARQGWFKHSYRKQKALDFILVTSYALLISTGLNRWASAPNEISLAAPSNTVLIAQKLKPETEERLSKKEKITNLKAALQSIKTNLKALKEELKAQEREKGKGAKGWLIALTIILALALGYVVTGLACGIACSGQEGLAWAALIVGWAGIIWLSIIVIKKIARKHASGT